MATVENGMDTATNHGRFGPGNRGRPKGAKNKTTLEILEVARRMMTKPSYLRELERRMRDGTAPHMEKFFAEHLWGKPKERVEITGIELAALNVLLIEARNGTGNGNGSNGHEAEAEPVTIDIEPSKDDEG